MEAVAMDSKVALAEGLKNVMRQIPYPVTIVTAAVGKTKRGSTIGSFTSLSLAPPLISFNVDRSSQMHALLNKATHFTVHIPEASQSDLCNHFAVPDLSPEEQFEEIAHSRSPYGSPVLEDFVAVIHCRKYDEVPAGDHTIMIGEVLDIEQHKEEAAILYLNGVYHALHG